MFIRKFFLVLGIGFFAFNFIARQPQAIAQENAPFSASDRIFKEPDVLPFYTGGPAAMRRFISNTMRYPDDARERRAQGLVVYTFVVEKDGTLSNFNIIHRADSLLDQEALRILQSMPPWRAARHNGEIVRSETYVPMYFRLNSNAGQAARTAAPATPVVAKEDKTIIENEDIFSIVDVMPRYETGEEGLARFISNALRYPVQARQDGIQGRILCAFVVGKDGTISNIEVVESLHPALDQEAIRVLSMMPRWIPGQNDNRNVNVKCLLPIDFVIDETPIKPA